MKSLSAACFLTKAGFEALCGSTWESLDSSHLSLFLLSLASLLKAGIAPQYNDLKTTKKTPKRGPIYNSFGHLFQDEDTSLIFP